MKLLWAFIGGSVIHENFVSFCQEHILVEILLDFMYMPIVDEFLVNCLWRLKVNENLLDCNLEACNECILLVFVRKLIVFEIFVAFYCKVLYTFKFCKLSSRAL